MNVFIFDDQPIIRRGIFSLIKAMIPDANLVEFARLDYFDGLHVLNLKPDLFIIEPDILDVDRLFKISMIRSTFREIPIVIFSTFSRDDSIQIYEKMGMDCVLAKHSQVSELNRKLFNFFNFFESKNTYQKIKPMLKLSRRQKEIVVMLDRGLTNFEISQELNISEHTVKVHLWRFYKKCGVCSRTQLTRFARDNFLI